LEEERDDDIYLTLAWNICKRAPNQWLCIERDVSATNDFNMNRTMSDESKEKPVIAHVEDTNHLQKTESSDYHTTTLRGDEVHHDAAFEKRVIRKVDMRLLIILGALYSIALIDRTNLSSARVAGMAKDLKL
jgi:hypothetical protein